MSTATRVAVVTGSNKGIGYAIVKGLAKQFDGVVYLTSRNVELGKTAVESLAKEGVKANYHQLDITDSKSVDQFAKYVKEQYGGIDVLINNAGILFMSEYQSYMKGEPEVAGKYTSEIEQTVNTNYTSTIKSSQVLFPLLRSHARVVNVASTLGMLKYVTKQELRDRFTDPNATIEQINQLVEEYLQQAKNGKSVESGFPLVSYFLSKVALIAATRIQQKDIAKDTSRSDILINACCPGYVATDINNHSGYKTTEQGAETPIHLAMIPANAEGPKGEFWYENHPIDWCNLNHGK